jgi:hypothetical protein
MSLKKQMQEMSDASKYDALLVKAQQENKSILPRRPDTEETINTEDDMRLQINLANNYLKEIVSSSSPALINVISEYLKENDYLIYFNKYFNTFKKVLNSKIRSIDSFKRDWDLFYSQQLGSELQSKPPITITESSLFQIVPKNVVELNNASNETIDALFKQALEKSEGKSLDQISVFSYPTTKRDPKTKQVILSQPIKIVNKEGIIAFKTSTPTKGTTPMEKINNIKIKTILFIDKPDIDVKNLNDSVNWKSSTIITSKIQGTGFLKKKSIHMMYR